MTSFRGLDIVDFIPKAAVSGVRELLAGENLEIKLKKERKTRHGDYRQLSNGMHQISINTSLNPYRFLITLIHELAHLKAYAHYGKQIKPHGKEWKFTFQKLMLPFINPKVFPQELLGIVANHFRSPKASSDTDHVLALALKKFNPKNDKVYVQDLELGTYFKLYNGRIFRRGMQRRKRIECEEYKSGKRYLFNPLAEVDLVE